jgi:hypothetical protein
MTFRSRRLALEADTLHYAVRRAEAGGGTTGEAPAWERFVAAPAPGQHVARLYTDPEHLGSAVAAFLGAGLRAGDAVLVVATPDHRERIARRLAAEGLDLGAPGRRGQAAVLDAAETLARLLVGGGPDPARFAEVIGRAVDAARTAGFRQVRAFGEMVDLLRRTDLAATARLESLWSDLLAAGGMALLCGYSVDPFDPRVYGGLLQRVCLAHSDVVPAEDPERFRQAVERAYVEVFGAAGDGDGLRQAFVAEYARPASMPEAAAALLAARQFLPGAAARALLDRAGRHYHGAGAR